MRTKTEINDALDKLRRLREVIPHHSIFGDDNWRKLDRQVNALVGSANRSEDWIENESNAAAERDDAMLCDVFDWILGIIDEPLAEESDIEAFTKQKRGLAQ